MNVLYEDNHLLVVEKPVNMPAQADASGDPDLLSACREYIRDKYQKHGAAYLGLVHRLDRPVGGVVAFARTSKAAARLSGQLRTHEMRREYLAVVRGTPDERGELSHFLLKDPKTNTTRAVPEGTQNAKPASLSYRCLDTAEGLSLLAIRLHTGRSHQIRVQFAESGYPIWGDARYGGGRPGQQIALFARALSLTHPVKREEMTFSLPFPSQSPWNLFDYE